VLECINWLSVLAVTKMKLYIQHLRNRSPEYFYRHRLDGGIGQGERDRESISITLPR